MKFKIITVLLLSSLLVACGSKNETVNTNTSTPENNKIVKEENNNEKTVKNTELGLEEYWEVPNQWKLKIDSVYSTSDRNQFADENPAEVLIVKYTYENLGYESEDQDLYLSPNRIVDSANKLGYFYPGDTARSPQPTPVGVICEGAEVCFGVDNESNEAKIYFESYDNNDNLQKITFKVPVTK